MLKKMSLKNFKNFSTLENLEFKPVTVLCGVNSSGKSSILKSILLLKQTMESQQIDNCLSLNGKTVKLGSFKNIIHNHEENSELGFSLNFSFEDLQNKSRKNNIKAIIKDFYKIDLNKTQNNALNFSFGFKKHPDKLILSKLLIEGNGVFLKLEHAEKNNYILNCENVFNFYRDGKKGTTLKNKTVNVKFNNSLIPNITVPLSNKNEYEDFLARRSVDTMCHYSGIVLRELLGKIGYIGPLRKEPARRYIYEEEISSIGDRGENAAIIYAKEKDNNIRAYFYNENKNCFEEGEYKFKTALNKWLKIMNIIDFNNSQHEEIIRLNVKNSSGIKIDISDVGFGVSQVLPILKLQMQLMDFFIAMAKKNKNTIIETHSEHMINRLVRRSLEDENTAKLINIYFIDEKSNIELIKIDKKRGIVNWPENFFDQAANEQKEILNLVINNSKE